MTSPSTPRRIISLLASSTEIVCALGLQGQLVGISHECDYPEEVSSLPRCSEPKFGVHGTSYQIDQRVKALLQEGLSIYRVDSERLAELAPDVIITQDHCEVCAVSLSTLEQACCELLPSNPKIVSLHPNSLEDIWSDIRLIANACGVVDRGEQLIRDLEARLSACRELMRSCARKRIVCIEWIAPLMVAGNWLPQLVSITGASDPLGKPRAHSPAIEFDQIISASPEVLVVCPCGYDIPATEAEMTTMQALPGWRDLPAVKSGEVYLIDGNQFFNRPGPRIVESTEILCEILNPGTFPNHRTDRSFVHWRPAPK